MFLIFALIFAAYSVNLGDLVGKIGLGKDSIVGGEVTEIVSAPSPTDGLRENSMFQSALAASAEISGNNDIDLESAPYDAGDLLITGEDSILQNQNPITEPPIIEPKSSSAPVKPQKAPLPRYAAGPYLDGYFIFPTNGFNRGKLHAYNAVDISRGDSCLSENIPVYAAASGIISAIYPTESASRYANGGYGNNILILHPNGVLTRYAHLKTILVSDGQYVNQGSVIAFMGGYPGNVGSGNSTGCHLHFEVRGAKNPFVR